MTLSEESLICYICKKPCDYSKDAGKSVLIPNKYFHYDCLEKTNELDGVYFTLGE